MRNSACLGSRDDRKLRTLRIPIGNAGGLPGGASDSLKPRVRPDRLPSAHHPRPQPWHLNAFGGPSSERLASSRLPSTHWSRASFSSPPSITPPPAFASIGAG